jgi:dephospho-CoA kinase
MAIPKNIPLIGVTGGIGCGQSTVCKIFEKYGAGVINADLIAKDVVEKNSDVINEIKENFGAGIFNSDGTLNRRELAQIAFSSVENTKKLNSIIHPKVIDTVNFEILKAKESGKFKLVVIDAALIYETKMEKIFDYVVVVSSTMGNRIKRIIHRDGLTEKEIMDRIKAQMPVEKKAEFANFVIENDGTIQELEEKVKEILAKID